MTRLFCISRTMLFVMAISVAPGALAAGPYPLQAPYDSYVCYDISFIECFRQPQLANFDALMRTIYGSDFKANSITINDPDADTVTRSSDNRFSCNNSKIPYTQRLEQTKRAVVVFVSPSLISAVAEQLETLKRVRLGCSQLLDTYNSFMQNMKLLDTQDSVQQSVQYLNSLFDFWAYHKDPIPPAPGVNLKLETGHMPNLPAASDCPPGGLGFTLPSAIKLYRECAITVAVKVRDNVKQQAINNDYKHQFDNAQLAIDVQARQVANSLWALDSEVISVQGQVGEKNYQNGTWVQKGTVVLSAGP